MEVLAKIECRLWYKICKVIFVSGEAVLNGCLKDFCFEQCYVKYFELGSPYHSGWEGENK